MGLEFRRGHLQTMAKITFSISIIVPMIGLSLATDTLGMNRSISHGETLVSSDQTFELGFFTPGNSSKSYLGIWYKFSPKMVVWVANRNNPLADRKGVLTFTNVGNLVVLNQSNGVVWSSESSRVLRNPIVQLLDSGNLVLLDNSVSSSDESYSWQSFDYPSDTLLAGMKLVLNLKTGLERRLTAWKSMDDPSPGDYVHGLNYSQGLPQYEVVQVDSHRKIFRTGQWNGVQFVGLPSDSNPAYVPIFVYNETEISYMFEVQNRQLFSTMKLNYLGVLQIFVVNRSKSATWNVMCAFPSDLCDFYGSCGANAICSSNLCECVKGFMPKLPDEWAVRDFSGGCKRTIPTNCSKGEGFSEINKVKLPDLLEVTLNRSMSLKECNDECLKNCSCVAYANSDITGDSGCLMWFGDLIDMRVLEEGNYVQTLYVRLSASELGIHTYAS
ncbi:G-type lectin S-receptor-like serine/threonine-protein kinase At4g27290 [Syzygium oleosum]|uniref:G-type lectin S-receptor-like serine/threonine-protein kinase At4g27290 n=1 Tax=Syzygium oleosum TaxID=219896 RepID=UPI0024BAD3BD|nr:G-type lectin S-receptor-like serine/threonine-protein kinase At4g27290 [Syzygium oleosum]